MVKQYNPPATIPVYLGSGKAGAKLRENLEKRAGGGSLSKLVVDLLRKADPSLFKGVSDDKKVAS